MGLGGSLDIILELGHQLLLLLSLVLEDLRNPNNDKAFRFSPSPFLLKKNKQTNKPKLDLLSP